MTATCSTEAGAERPYGLAVPRSGWRRAAEPVVDIHGRSGVAVITDRISTDQEVLNVVTLEPLKELFEVGW
jgi:hypothetical protein